MSDAPTPPLVVVLRFADRTLVDIVFGHTDRSVIAEAAKVALTNGAVLPLLEASTSAITPEALAKLQAVDLPEPPPKGAPPTFVPVTGLVHAVRTYFAGVKNINATPAAIEQTRDVLRAFGDRHGMVFDFAGEPEGKIEGE